MPSTTQYAQASMQDRANVPALKFSNGTMHLSQYCEPFWSSQCLAIDTQTLWNPTIACTIHHAI